MDWLIPAIGSQHFRDRMKRQAMPRHSLSAYLNFSSMPTPTKATPYSIRSSVQARR